MKKIDGENLEKYVCEDFVCKKSIRNSLGKIDAKLCYSRVGHTYEIITTEYIGKTKHTEKVAISEEAFRKELRERKGRVAANIIFKKLQREANKSARQSYEPCEYHYNYEYSIYSPKGFDLNSENPQ
jgi:hypothetical protein